MSLGPPPRHLQRRPGGNFFGTCCLRLFILPHTLVGIGVILLFMSKLAMGLVGIKTDAHIIAKTTSRGSKGGTGYHVKFNFPANGERYEGKSQVNQSTYQSLPDQGRIPIVYLALAPQYFADYQDPQDTFPSNTWTLLCFALFWNAIVGVFVYIIYIAPWREKRLIIHGGEADGKVLAKRLGRTTKGGTTYTIDYSYEVLGTTYQDKARVNQRIYDTTPEGASLSVAYDPDRPKRSVAVDLSDWKVIP